MHRSIQPFAIATLVSACLAACGGGGGAAGTAAPTAAPASVKVPLMISDASSQDWSSIQVILSSVVFVSASGNTANLLAAPMTVNLEQLDHLGEFLSSASLTAGATYTGAVLTLSANPGDVSLTVASDPESGFPEAPSTATAPDVIPASRIQIQGAQGAPGSQTVTVPVPFTAPFVAPTPASGTTPASTAGIDIEFDLGHPAFLVGHTPIGGGSTVWAVNFKGPVHDKPAPDLTHLVLRDFYATAGVVSSDNLSLAVTRDLPTLPVVSPETETATGQALAIGVDATNGTLFYDLDAHTHSTITDYAGVAARLDQQPFVRVAARYQADGSLVATRIYVSNLFNNLFVSPEGHVVHVDSAQGAGFVVDDASGKPTPVGVDAATQFFFRKPGTAADVTPIGVGPAFLTTGELVRGFKVHVTPVDPNATPLVAATVEIEAAPFEGRVGNVTAAGFALSASFASPGDDYAEALPYIGSASANGKDPLSGAAITGFKFWDFAYPTLVTSGSGAVPGFEAATGGSVSFGGSAPAYAARALSYAVWGDPASANGWSAADAILLPTTLPRTTVATGISASAPNSFTIATAGGTNAVTVDFSTASGSATLAYQVDRTGDVVTVSPQDLSTSTGLAAFAAGLQAGARVRVSAVPQSDGSLKAYVVDYFTGTAPQ
ncbi:MAG: hypothetical protein KGJ30_13665 [Burkholderiales bacterium]|nr:hypothetical protein [Burkholderiales bacterium]MDE2159957.1 hypothetical protein [Burkholderiales bacterium]